jgi:methyl halide transferase
MRSLWGERMNQILATDGRLITLVFPIDGGRTGGPPYSVDPEMVRKALMEASNNAVWESVYDEVPKSSGPNHQGRERMIVWKKHQNNSVDTKL